MSMRGLRTAHDGAAGREVITISDSSDEDDGDDEDGRVVAVRRPAAGG